MYAEGDELHYDLTLTTIETTDDDRSVYAEALEAGLAETAQTFVDAAKDVQKSVSNETVLVVVTILTPPGVLRGILVRGPPSPEKVSSVRTDGLRPIHLQEP